MRNANSRQQAYDRAALKVCKVGKFYADEKQLGSVSRLYKMSVLLLADAKFKIDTGFTNQEITDKEIDYALKYIQNV